ncbi:MAG: response regulator, partial [Elusimicrobia bacterium]|nr:response regulator [Elusimicrobiota bacterium]
MSDVLIFDDDPAVADLLSGLLHARGLSVDAYTSGAGVVQTALDSRPKLLILDVMMPGMDGLTACRMIRANAAASRVKILILTAKRFAEDRAAAQRYGADAFLAKPFQVSELERTIEKLLGLPVAPEAPAPKAPDLRASFLGGAAVLKADSLWIFCDAGAGLARFVAAQSAFPPECWLLLSRYEPAALADLESLSAVPAKGSRLKIMGPDDPEGTLQRLAPRLTRPLGGRATPLLYPQREGEFILAPGVQGKALYTQHPGPTLAYRVNFGGLGAVWCPAHEISSEAAAWRG